MLQGGSTRRPGCGGALQGGGATSTGPAAGDGFEIILQGFNWESHKGSWYKTLGEQAKKIAQAGITAVWLPPPSASVSPQVWPPRAHVTRPHVTWLVFML